MEPDPNSVLTITFAGVSSTGTPATIVAAILANAAALQAAGISSSGSPITAANISYSAGVLSWTNLSKNFGNPNVNNTEFTLTGEIDFNGQTGVDSDTLPIFTPAVFDNNTFDLQFLGPTTVDGIPGVALNPEGIGGLDLADPATNAADLGVLVQATCSSKQVYTFGRPTTAPAALNLYQYNNAYGPVSVVIPMPLATDYAAGGVPLALNTAGAGKFTFTQGGTVPALISAEIASLGLSSCAGFRWSTWTDENELPQRFWIENPTGRWASGKVTLLTNLRR